MILITKKYFNWAFTNVDTENKILEKSQSLFCGKVCTEWTYWSVYLVQTCVNVIKSPFYYWCFEIFQVKIKFQTINHWLHIKLSILSSMTLFDKNMLKFYLHMIKGREVSRGRVTHIIRTNNTKMAGDNAERSKTDSPACLEFITWNKDPTIFW